MSTLSWPDDKTLALSIVVNVEEGAEMSIADGGTERLTLNPGHAFAGQFYLVLGSVGAPGAGFPVGPHFVPLDPSTAYITYTLTNPNPAPFTDSFGTIEPFGFANAVFNLGAGAVSANLAGTGLVHAFVTFDLTGEVTFASNAAPLVLVP